MIQRANGSRVFVFDCHVHLGENSLMARFGLGMRGFLAEDVLKKMDAVGVDKIVAFPVANPHTDYAIDNMRIVKWGQEYPDRIIPFVRLQPHFEEQAVADVARYAALGARGLKFHPRIDGGYNLNDPLLVRPIIDEARKHKLVVLFHTGETYNNTAGLLADLAMDYPTVTFICGHMGMGDSFYEGVAFARRLDNMYLDTTDMWPPSLIKLAVHRVGAEKVVWGSDTPYIPVEAEIDKLMKHAGLADGEIRKIMGENTARILGISVPDGR